MSKYDPLANIEAAAALYWQISLEIADVVSSIEYDMAVNGDASYDTHYNDQEDAFITLAHKLRDLLMEYAGTEALERARNTVNPVNPQGAP